MLGDHQKDSGLCVMCHVSSYQATYSFVSLNNWC